MNITYLLSKFLFNFKIFNYKEDTTLTELFKEIIKVDFEIESYRDHEFIITSDNYRMFMWNANKYYAWISRGHVVDKENNIVYSWNDGRPSKSILYDFMKKYENKLILFNKKKITKLLPL